MQLQVHVKQLLSLSLYSYLQQERTLAHTGITTNQNQRTYKLKKESHKVIVQLSHFRRNFKRLPRHSFYEAGQSNSMIHIANQIFEKEGLQINYAF